MWTEYEVKIQYYVVILNQVNRNDSIPMLLIFYNKYAMTVQLHNMYIKEIFTSYISCERLLLSKYIKPIILDLTYPITSKKDNRIFYWFNAFMQHEKYEYIMTSIL